MKIIKQGLINFLSKLKYFFVPLGTLFLGIIIGLSISLPLIHQELKNFVMNITALQLELDYNSFIDYFMNEVNKLDWNNAFNALGIIVSKSWLENTLINSLKVLVVNYDQYINEINVIVIHTINLLATYIIVLVIFIASGFIGGYFLTKYFIRKEMANRNLWQFILHTSLDMLLSGMLVTLCIYLLSLWQISGVFSTLISYLLFATVSLFEAYLVHGYNKIPFKDIVNFHNCSNLLISNTTIVFVGWIFSSICTTFFNEFAGAVIGFTMMEIAFIVISLNAENYAINWSKK